jgi:hypothetical protein
VPLLAAPVAHLVLGALLLLQPRLLASPTVEDVVRVSKERRAATKWLDLLYSLPELADRVYSFPETLHVCSIMDNPAPG